MSDTDDIVGIAFGLTGPMRYALLRAYPDKHDGRLIPAYTNTNSVYALQRRGLADGWRLTDLGVRVRALLAAEGGDPK